MNTEQAINPIKMWWPGDKSVEPFMPPIAEAISRHLPSGDAWTDIYNRAYEAVYSALRAQQDRENPKPLTLAQLKERVGKPVWTVTIGVDGSGRWELVDFQKPQYDGREVLSLCSLSDGLYDCFADTYGKTWLAYYHQPTV